MAFEGIPSRHTEDGKYPCITSALRAVVWRIMLGALPLKTQDWSSQQKTNQDTYQLWLKELTKTVDDLRQLYEKNGNVEKFEDEFKLASKTYREYRISVIRNPKMKRYSHDEILGNIDAKYRGDWFQLFKDQDLAEEI